MSPKLVINADDLGYDPAVSRGLLRAMREGIVGSATCMVNLPSSEEAARAATGLAVGLHLNLARGRPVSNAIPESLLDHGAFDEARAARLEPAHVADEAAAQLARLEAWLGIEATHVDVHKHLHRHPGILEGLARVAAARDLPVRSIDADMRAALRAWGVATNDHFLGDAGADAYWTEDRLVETLANLPTDGVIELMCHPGHAPSHLTSGYADQREVELSTFLSPAARQALAACGATPATFTVLKRRKVW